MFLNVLSEILKSILSPLSFPPSLSPGVIISLDGRLQTIQHSRGPASVRLLAGLLTLFLIFVFKELVELVGPVAHTSDVKCKVVLNLWGGTDGERMPFIGRNSERNLCKKYFVVPRILTSGSSQRPSPQG